MHADLELLLQIQDLKSQRRELRHFDAGRAVEQQEFHIDPEQALAMLDDRIEELKAQLPPAVRDRLERFEKGHGRAVAPVLNGVCYGCFTAIATADLSDLERNDEVRTCRHCDRFLYVVPA